MSDAAEPDPPEDTSATVLRALEERKRVIDNIIKWFKALVVGCGVAVLSVLLVTLVVYSVVTTQADQRERDRVARTVESCRQYNRDQTKSRVFAHEQLIEVASLFGSADRAEQLRHDPRLGAYDQFAAEQFPYRRCAPDGCAVSYTDPKIPDCPFAETEGG